MIREHQTNSFFRNNYYPKLPVSEAKGCRAAPLSMFQLSFPVSGIAC